MHTKLSFKKSITSNFCHSQYPSHRWQLLPELTLPPALRDRIKTLRDVQPVRPSTCHTAPALPRSPLCSSAECCAFTSYWKFLSRSFPIPSLGLFSVYRKAHTAMNKMWSFNGQERQKTVDSQALAISSLFIQIPQKTSFSEGCH